MPQALVLVLPTLGNNIIELFKATSLLSIITVHELVFYAGRVLAQTLQTMNVWILVGIFYFIVAWPASVGIRRLEIALTRWSHHGNRSQSRY
jgi:polar amino acid transport system permease protein